MFNVQLTLYSRSLELECIDMSARFPQPITRRRFLRASASGAAAIAFYPGLSSRADSRPYLLAGASKRRVTPPLSVPYLTSSGNGTSAPFKGIHDDLFARALVLDNGHEKIAILSVDAIGYDNSILGKGRDFTRELRSKAARRTGLKADAIMLAATHTHSAPETIGLTPFRTVPGAPEWLESHLQELVETVVDAWKNRVPVRAFAGVTKADGIARYRRIVLRTESSACMAHCHRRKRWLSLEIGRGPEPHLLRARRRHAVRRADELYRQPGHSHAPAASEC